MTFNSYVFGTDFDGYLKMIKISKLADYAVVLLAACALNDEAQLSAAALSAATKLPEPTVSKVLKLLSKAGIVTASRGANGGYALNHAPEEISVAQILESIDGPIALTACVENFSGCHYAGCCCVNGRWDKVNAAMHESLSGITLRDMIPRHKAAL